MRLVVISFLVGLPGIAWAQSDSSDAAVSQKLAPADEFRLGGAASRSAIITTSPSQPIDDAPQARLSLPLGMMQEETTQRELGPATLFLSDGMDDGRDALQLGTFLSRGQARAGLSVTYLETQEEFARSEVFLDYALTETFSVGLSGIIDSEANENEPVRQLGLNAEFSTSGGAFVQGGVSGAADYEPVVGLSIGLRF